MRKTITTFVVALVAGFALHAGANACTISPRPGGAFYGTGLVGQYCIINPPVEDAVTGQCWGCTGGGWSGPKCGWHPFAGTATPANTAPYGYTFDIASDIGHVVRTCGQSN